MTNSATKIEMAQNIAQNIAQNMAEKTNSLDRSLTLAAVKNIANTKFGYDFMIPKNPKSKSLLTIPVNMNIVSILSFTQSPLMQVKLESYELNHLGSQSLRHF
jgi:hypothetical protein